MLPYGYGRCFSKIPVDKTGIRGTTWRQRKVRARSVQSNPPPLILLIENDESDVFLFRRALHQLRFKGDVRVVGSVTQATAYMEKAQTFGAADYFRVPCLIVSDFKLVGHTALDFVRWLRQQGDFTAI